MNIASLLVVLALAGDALAHVALTFPQAKYPPYDFLDNTRTGPPCGVSDEPSSRTTLVAGQSYNFTFHLAYPHHGGFCFNILAKNGTVLRNLTDGFVDTSVSTSQRILVKIPEINCPDCIVQLIRQALEWTGPVSYTQVYLFWSCADVNIVPSSSPIVCGGTGCTGHGQCVNDTCQCTGLWYGQFCQYKDGCLADSDCSGHGSCVSLSSTSQPRSECFCNAKWQGLNCETASPLMTATVTPADYDGYLKATDDLEYWFKQENDYIEVGIKYSGLGEWIGFGFRPTSVSTSCWAQSPGHLPATARGNTDVVPWADAAKGEAWGTPIKGATNEEGEEEAAGLHAMDCTDMVISRVKGNQYRILDYYTRDRSTPQVDNWYGGYQNLTAAIGASVDGVTWIRFRKPIRAGGDRFDHDIQDAKTHIIWAHGQVIGSYDPPVPGAGNAGVVTNFYQPLELKYHGGKNRGVTQNNFFNPFTVSCKYTNDDYTAEWGVPEDDASVLAVELTLKNGEGKWVGMGYSSDSFMPNSDIITGLVNGDSAVVRDRFASAKATPPVDDDQDQITKSEGSFADGTLTIRFRRKLVSADAKDVSINTPRYLLFAWGNKANDDIAYHGSTRGVTASPVDVTTCTSTVLAPTSPTSPPSQASEKPSAAYTHVASILLFFVSLSVVLFY